MLDRKLYCCGPRNLLSVMHIWLMKLRRGSLRATGFSWRLPVQGRHSNYLQSGRSIMLSTRNHLKKMLHTTLLGISARYHFQHLSTPFTVTREAVLIVCIILSLDFSLPVIDDRILVSKNLGMRFFVL